MNSSNGQRAHGGEVSTGSIEVSSELLAAVLRPYKPECRYLHSATVTAPGEPGRLVEIEGELSIPESCYIDDTGHFNSVEFNLCYNQLVYVLMAQCVVDGLLAPFTRWTLDEYLRRQLPDVLIHDFRSKFRRPMDMRAFTGRVWIQDYGDRSRFLLLHTGVDFQDAAKGSSLGEVSLAIVNRDPAGRGSLEGRSTGR